MNRGGQLPKLPYRVVVLTSRFDWKMCGSEGDPEFDYSSRKNSGNDAPIEVDGEEIRELFLNIRNPRQALEFYRKTNFPHAHSFAEIRLLQKFVKWASLHSFGSLLKKELEDDYFNDCLVELTDLQFFQLTWERGTPVLVCDALQLPGGVLRVIGALMQIEQLFDARRGVCARPDCWRTLPPNCRKDRRYCSRNCANVMKNREKRGVGSPSLKTARAILHRGFLPSSKARSSK